MKTPAPKHPMQPLVVDEFGVVRFRANPVVRFLLDQPGGASMNTLAVMGFTDEDRTHFAQLIGYSVGGFGELSYVDDASYAAAAEGRDKLLTYTPDYQI